MIYISGAISGHDIAERRATFAKAEKELTEHGYVPCNPFNNGVSEDAPTKDHMRADIEMMLKCDGIYLLDGWHKSAGCHTELVVAMAIGLDIYFQTDNRLLVHKAVEDIRNCIR